MGHWQDATGGRVGSQGRRYWTRLFRWNSYVSCCNASPTFSLFHFVLLFWNQVFTCLLLSCRDFAKTSLSVMVRYLFIINFSSRHFSWKLVNAVRRRRLFDGFLVTFKLSLFDCSSSNLTCTSEIDKLSVQYSLTLCCYKKWRFVLLQFWQRQVCASSSRNVLRTKEMPRWVEVLVKSHLKSRYLLGSSVLCPLH